MERIVDLLMFPLSPAELPGTEGCVAINYSATNGLSGIAFSKKIIVQVHVFDVMKCCDLNSIDFGVCC
jgi:hypothetical protein